MLADADCSFVSAFFSHDEQIKWPVFWSWAHGTGLTNGVDRFMYPGPSERPAALDAGSSGGSLDLDADTMMLLSICIFWLGCNVIYPASDVDVCPCSLYIFWFLSCWF